MMFKMVLLAFLAFEFCIEYFDMVFPMMFLDFVKSAPCVSFLLRKRALYNDMSRYSRCSADVCNFTTR